MSKISDSVQLGAFLKKNGKFVLLVFLLEVLAVVDHYDLGILSGVGIFTRAHPEALVTFVVGFPLLITVWQAFRSISETRRTTELSLRPFLRLEYSRYKEPYNADAGGSLGVIKMDLWQYQILLINEGSGVAVDVKFEPIKLKGIEQSFEIKTVTAMSPKGGSTRLKDEALTPEDLDLLDPGHAVEPYEVKVKYKNLEGTSYPQVFISSRKHNDGYEVIEW